MGDVKKSLTNCLTAEHCFVIGELMTQFQDLKQRIENGEKELFIKIEPYRHLVTDVTQSSKMNTVKASGQVFFQRRS